ncbi:hypothetical protein LEMLEM_LOCUS12556 [Lemmus lemmus]
MENIRRVWIMFVVFSLKFLTVKELNIKRHFTGWAAKLIQHIYSKGVLISRFGSREMMLWKGGSSFVFTEDETLWISSIPIWYDRPRPPERLQ